MNITEEQRQQFQAWIREEYEKYGQFNVQQVRPGLVDMTRTAMEAKCRDLQRWEVSNFAFQTQCLLNYVHLLEQELEKHQERKQPDVRSFIFVSDDEIKPNFIQKVSSFFYKLYHGE